MRVKYDRLERLEKPELILCNPGSKLNSDGTITRVIGGINDPKDLEFVFNFNSPSQINFRVYKSVRDTNTELSDSERYLDNIYNSIQNKRVVFVQDFGFFIISDKTDHYDNGIRYKDVTAHSAETELEQKGVPYISGGTYKFGGINNEEESIMNILMKSIPLWTIAHIDKVLSERYRTFEDVDPSLNCLSFMLKNIQDAYECILEFDPLNRQIYAYDRANYIRRTKVFLSPDDFVNSLSVQENSEDIYTALTVRSSDGVMISPVNPLGGNTIYDFSYFKSWMSDSLRTKVDDWEDAVMSYSTTYSLDNKSYHIQNDSVINLESELAMYQSRVDMYRKLRENIVAGASKSVVSSNIKAIEDSGGSTVTIKENIQDTLLDINNLIAETENNISNTKASIASASTERDRLNEKITSEQKKISLSGYFTESELEELTSFIFEGVYTDEYITFTDIMSVSEKFDQMKELYSRGLAQLKKISYPTQEYSVSSENFIFVKSLSDMNIDLEVGSLVNLELNKNDVAELFLSNMTVNYDDYTLSMTFGNRYNRFDPKALFDNALGDISKTANTVNYIKDIIFPIKSGEFNLMREILKNSRNLSMDKALSSDNQEVSIDQSGYTGRATDENGNIDPKQIKIVNNNIVFTDDGWETSKVAIGEIFYPDGGSRYGVNAEVLMGDLIVGNELRIIDKDGNDMFTVMEGKISMSVGKKVDEYVEENKDSLKGADGTSSYTHIMFAKALEEQEQLVHNEELALKVANAPQIFDGHTERIIYEADDRFYPLQNKSAQNIEKIIVRAFGDVYSVAYMNEKYGEYSFTHKEQAKEQEGSVLIYERSLPDTSGTELEEALVGIYSKGWSEAFIYYNPLPKEFSNDPKDAKYIGIYNGDEETSPTDASAYKWSLIKGEDGADGADGKDGKDGADGTSSYTYIRYSPNANGSSMTKTPQATSQYIGIAISTNPVAPTSYTAYTWSRFKGTDGTDADPNYTWIKYADTPTTGMSDSPAMKRYIGIAYNKRTETPSSNYSDYTWAELGDQKALDDLKETATQKYTEYESRFEVHEEAITNSVSSETYYDSIDGLEKSLKDIISSETEQTTNAFNFKFQAQTEIIEKNAGEVDVRLNSIESYFRVTPEGLELGSSENPIILKIKPDRIAFEEGGQEVAYISDSSLYITHANIVDSMQWGKFRWVHRGNGNFSLV